jgi:glutamine amidotransferase
MLAIVDYGSGNLRSAARAFERVGADVWVTRSPEDIKQASHIVLPGVGAFSECMQGLLRIPGMLDALSEAVLVKRKLFLGICVGMQMLFEEGHEHGVHKGLGWLKGKVVPLVPGTLKIPHMGWNELQIIKEHPLLNGVEPGSHAYFVHSYHAECPTSDAIFVAVQYGQTIAAVVGQGNIFGTQFHPEKSQDMGLRLLKNFIAL